MGTTTDVSALLVGVPTTAEQIRDLDHDYVFHSWSAQAETSPLPVAGGQGATFWDHDGNEYLDFSSQLVNLNLGHQHPDLIRAIHDQAERLATVAPSFANDIRGELARRIVGAAGGSLSKVFFTNGGAEANEHAVRMARLHTGRRKVLTTYRSYHGATGTAIALTGDPRRWASEPADASVVHFFGPYPYRSAFHAQDAEEEAARAMQHLEQVLTLEGPQTVAAVLLETVVGTNGILVPPLGYLEGVRELCDRHGVLLILDEVMAGFGRCGRIFAYQEFGVTPDLVTFAKGVNSGYVPLGGVVISESVARTFDHRAYPGGLTYSGHPLACATGVATFQVLERDDTLAQVRDVAQRVIRPALEDIAGRHPSVGEFRGLGMFWALELVRDQESREPLVPFNAVGKSAQPMADLVAACKSRGLWPFTHFNRVHVVPPLVISESDLRRGLDVLDEALDVADRHADQR